MAQGASTTTGVAISRGFLDYTQARYTDNRQILNFSQAYHADCMCDNFAWLCRFHLGTANRAPARRCSILNWLVTYENDPAHSKVGKQKRERALAGFFYFAPLLKLCPACKCGSGSLFARVLPHWQSQATRPGSSWSYQKLVEIIFCGR